LYYKPILESFSVEYMLNIHVSKWKTISEKNTKMRKWKTISEKKTKMCIYFFTKKIKEYLQISRCFFSLSHTEILLDVSTTTPAVVTTTHSVTTSVITPSVTTQQTPTLPPVITTDTLVQDFSVTIRILSEVWNPLYTDSTSEEYQNLTVSYYQGVSMFPEQCVCQVTSSCNIYTIVKSKFMFSKRSCLL
jgi:hypothetical protein